MTDDAASKPSRPVAGSPETPGYDAFEEIGRGGQAVVYRATQTKLGRAVAIKVLEATGDDAVLRQFRREGEAMSARARR